MWNDFEPPRAEVLTGSSVFRPRGRGEMPKSKRDKKGEPRGPTGPRGQFVGRCQLR